MKTLIIFTRLRKNPYDLKSTGKNANINEYNF